MQYYNSFVAKRVSAVYFLFDNQELVYIGQSGHVYPRILHHFWDKTKTFDSFALFPHPPEGREALERDLIHFYWPVRYNYSVKPRHIGEQSHSGIRSNAIRTRELKLEYYDFAKRRPVIAVELNWRNLHPVRFHSDCWFDVARIRNRGWRKELTRLKRKRKTLPVELRLTAQGAIL